MIIMLIVCVQSTPKHSVYEELTPIFSSAESLVDHGQCCEEPAECDQDPLYTDEEIDDYHFSDSLSESGNDEMIAHGLDIGITPA